MIDGIIPDNLVRNGNIISYVTDPTDTWEELNSITENNIYTGLQIWRKLEKYFLTIDTNTKRALNLLN